jgi:hypothetical protein
MSQAPTLPPLFIPQSGELIANFVIQEWNCLDCLPSFKWMTDQGSITQHILWLYQSVNALKSGDIMIILSEYFLISAGSGLSLDESYYPGGLIQAIIDAMNRGANVFLLFERFYLGGRDKHGKCSYCTTTGTPFYCDSESNPPKTNPPTQNSRLYPEYCDNANNSLKLLQENENFIYYDIGYDSTDNLTIHNHFKGLSFYYKSTNACSVYQGSWNLNTTTNGNKIEESGFGFVCKLNEDFAQYYLYTDIQNLLVLENYYFRYTRNASKVMSTFLKDNYFLGTIPTQPINIPKLIICGPNYCDPNFGCGANGSLRKQYRPNTCTRNETFVTAVDYNVSITIGVDPSPQNSTCQTKWGTKGFPSTTMKYGANLVTKLISSSEKFLKTYIHGQLLEMGSCSSSTGNCPCIWSLESSIEQSIHTMLSKKIPWFVIQNDGWQTANSDSLIAKIMKTNTEKQYVYPKAMGFCGRRTNINDPTNAGYLMTHAKIYVNEKSVLITTAHPVVSHYNGDLTNRDVLFEKSPGMAAYINNHFNYVYNKCGIFDTGLYRPVGPYRNGMPDNMSCLNNDTCCTTDKYNIYVKDSPFTECNLPPDTNWSCTNNTCVSDPNGTFLTLSECRASTDCANLPSDPKWKCANKSCVSDRNGNYNTLTDCLASADCKISDTKWKCINNNCVSDPSGTYNTLTECNTACKNIPPGPGSGSGSGTKSSLSIKSITIFLLLSGIGIISLIFLILIFR